MTHFKKDYKCPGCEVHRGFLAAFESLQSAIERKLNSLFDRYGTGIVFTGHSLGAAMANLGAAYFCEKYTVSLFVFGAPRVGNV